MHLEEFSEGTSLFHRLDPRVKFVTFLPYVLLIAFSDGIRVPVLALALSASMTVLARIDVRKLASRLAAVNVFVLLLWVVLPFSYPGREVFQVGPLVATREGISLCGSITLKTNGIVLATIAMLGTSDVFSLAHALVHLRMPKKLVYLFFFFYRYISVLHEEYVKLKRALSVRAFRPRTNLHTYRTYAYLIGMLIVRSYDHSQRIYHAMLCRGFTGRFPVITHFHMHGRDYVFGFGMVLLTVCLFILMSHGR